MTGVTYMKFNLNLLKSSNLVTRTIAQLSVVAVVAGVSTSAVSSSAFATLDSIAYNTTPQTISSGTLVDTVTTQTSTGGAGFTASFTAMNPGDTRTVFVAYANTGTDAATGLTLSANAASLLATDATRGLLVSVTSCTQAWVYTAGSATAATCGGTTAAVLTLPLATLISNTTGQAFSGNPTLAAGATLYLKFAVGLPTQTEVWANGTLAANGALGSTGITVSGNPASTITGLTASVTWVIHATADLTGGSNNL